MVRAKVGLVFQGLSPGGGLARGYGVTVLDMCVLTNCDGALLRCLTLHDYDFVRWSCSNNATVPSYLVTTCNNNNNNNNNIFRQSARIEYHARASEIDRLISRN